MRRLQEALHLQWNYHNKIVATTVLKGCEIPSNRIFSYLIYREQLPMKTHHSKNMSYLVRTKDSQNHRVKTHLTGRGYLVPSLSKTKLTSYTRHRTLIRILRCLHHSTYTTKLKSSLKPALEILWYSLRDHLQTVKRSRSIEHEGSSRSTKKPEEARESQTLPQSTVPVLMVSVPPAKSKIIIII